MPASNSASARKQIQRSTLNKQVLSTKPVRIDKSYLYYLEQHTVKQYASAIKKLLAPKEPSSPKHPFYLILQALYKNKGYITKGQIGKSSGVVPDESNYITGKRRRLSSIIKNLLDIRLIEFVGGQCDIYKIGQGFGATSVKLGSFIKMLALEQAMLMDFVSWIQNVYVVGNQSYEVRAKEFDIVDFNTTCWDFKAPVFIGPCTKSTTVYPKAYLIKGFAVVDVIGFRSYSINDAEALVARLKTVTLTWKSIRVFPIALAMNYEAKALDLLRQHGIVPLTHREVWGRNIQKLIKLYNAIMSGKDESNLDSIETVLKLSDSNTEKDGIFGCIKGDLFEVMTSLAYRSEGYDTTLQKKIMSFTDATEYEIDVVAVKGDNKCLLIECKGRSLSVEDNRDEIKRHFESRCKVASESFGWNVTEKYKNIEAIYFTTSDKSTIPTEYYNPQKSHCINCRVMSRQEVISCFESADNRLAKLIEQYY
jgi:hypothetical protein